ncbi:MAG: SET domain-containing protein [Thaumarchaeota archaeon]|nr:SET domain-containing protein [Nitrososphaerota archaeon]
MTHATSLLGLTVRPSPIAGLGLFATRDFPPRSHLTPYLGEVLTKAQLDARYGDDFFTAPYAVEVSSNIFVDSACLRGIGSYANGARGATRPNARFVPCPATKSVRLASTRRIRAGDEVLVPCGASYWLGSGTFSTDPAPPWEWATFPASCFLPAPVPLPSPHLGSPAPHAAPADVPPAVRV